MIDEQKQTAWTLKGKVGGQDVLASFEPPSSSKSDKSVDWPKLLGEAGLFIGLIAAWLFLAGWMYAYGFFYKFGLGISGLALSVDDYPSYGYLVAQEYWLRLIMIATGVAGAIFILRRAILPISPAASVFLALALAAALFVFAAALGTAKASSDYLTLRDNDYPGMHRVEISVAKEFRDAFPPDRTTSLASGCQRIFFANSDRLFLIRPLKGQTALWPPVTVIDRSHILAYRILPQADSCKM